MSMQAPNYRARGFTLLEVLIALAIVALSAGALLGAVTSSASNVIYLKEKTLAEWVALNRLTEIRIATDMPGAGRRKGSTTMAGMRWEWEEEVSELPIKGMFRIEVRAHRTGELVDDTKPVQQASTQQAAPTSSSTSAESLKIAWTTTVTGVMGASRSQIRDAVATPFTGNLATAGTPGGNPAPPPPKPGAPSS
jgi:general secretion pathway protein I